VMQMQWN